MKVSDVFPGISVFFDPEAYYPEFLAFPLDLFYSVAKYNKKENLVNSFFQKYYAKIENLFHHSFKNDISESFILLSVLKENGLGRRLFLSPEPFISSTIYTLTGSVPELNVEKYLDFEEVKPILIDHLRNYRRDICACLKEEASPETIEKVQETYQKFLQLSIESGVIDNPKELPFENYVSIIKDKIKEVILAIRTITNKTFDQNIDLNELEKNLDLDKFYLALAYFVLDLCKEGEKNNYDVPNFCAYIQNYVDAVKLVRENHSYDLTISFNLSSEDRINKYSVNDLINDYQQYLARHPEVKFAKISKNDIEQYGDLRDSNNLQKYLLEHDVVEELSASWEFVKNGTRDSQEKNNNQDKNRRDNPYSKKKTELTDQQRQINERRLYLDSTNYRYYIRGIDKFAGYMGYIYRNGTVIFEKFYEDITTYKPAISNATYIMDIENFIEMSKLSKVEIINFIKQGNTRVKRVYHTSSWSNRINAAINQNGYNQEIIDKIDRIINRGSLKRVQKQNDSTME